MFKKTIKYHDLDGNPIEEDFYFHMSKAEIAEMEMSEGGANGLSEYMRTIISSSNGGEIIRVFKEIIARSVGQRSEDGKRFIKTPEIRDAFMQSEAYSELFMELATNAEKGAEFVVGLVPKQYQDDLEKEMAQQEALEIEHNAQVVEGTVVENDEAIKYEKDPKDMTREELLEAMKKRNQEQISKNS